MGTINSSLYCNEVIMRSNYINEYDNVRIPQTLIFN